MKETEQLTSNKKQQNFHQTRNRPTDMTPETADMEPETVMDGDSARDKTGNST